MAIRIVSAKSFGPRGIVVVADLDADNPDPAGPDRLLERTYGSYESSRIDGETRAQYHARVRREFRALARTAAQSLDGADVADLLGADIT